MAIMRTRRTALATIAALAALGSSAARAQPSLPGGARATHDRLLVLDSHADILLPGSPRRSYAKDGDTFTSLEKLKTGGVDALVYAVAVSTGPRTAQGYAAAQKEAQAKLAAIEALPAQSNGRIEIARTADDVRRITGGRKIAVLIGFLNAYSLGEDLAAFDPYFAGGVRVAGLTHAGNNAFADSSRPQFGAGAEHGGLSPLGKAAVKRFNDLGVLIDVSQLTPQGVQQTLELSRAPVVATHSAARALVDSTRNLSDAELDAIKAKGGVVQITPFNPYLVPKPAGYDDALRALRRQYGLDEKILSYSGADGLPAPQRDAFFAAYDKLYPKATVKTFVDHIDYVAKRIGVDHVGVGSDFNHGSGVIGFADASEAPAVTAELLARGYSQADLAKIWGGNFLRVLAAAQAAASPG
ncbi:dipeptidase [Caulobacter segnis]|uniref:dipeptidase n=1 Tax=Caulobacter segnis TaxID=88688 RepID=UPI00240EE7F1|nr:dipeptidase [Caulobacter segnis]MDG2522536.1 dipeptidase [Caulobacter segnis]